MRGLKNQTKEQLGGKYMNAERGLQTMPVVMGRFEMCDSTAYWLCVSKMRKDVPARVARITAFQKAKKRRQILKKLMDWAYIGVCVGSTVCMMITMLNMAGMIR